MQGFNGAATQAVLVPAGIHDTDFPYVMLGSAAAFWSPGLSTAILDQASSLDPSSDFAVGVCIQPIVAKIGIPLSFALKGLSVCADAGYMDATAGSYGINAVTAGLSAEYSAFRTRTGMIAWDGITAGFGADYAQNRLTAQIVTDPITQTIPIDPDGGGPLAPFYESIAITPSIKAGIESNAFSLRLGASTGVTFFRAISLFAGGGATLGWARSGILVDASGTITVSQESEYLNGAIESPGTFSITGTTGERNAFGLSGYLAAGLKFRVAFFDLSVPVVYRPNDSLGAGVFIGAHL
jgi:hypothetical protein